MKNKFKYKYWYPISVDIEIKLRKVRIFIDKQYKKFWPFIFCSFLAVWLTWGTLQFLHDYLLIHNYAHFDALSTGVYSTWRTDGAVGSEPPIK